MSIHLRPSGFIPSPRGLIRVHAETGVPDLKEINKLISDVLTAHNTFKSEVEASLKQKADVVTTEKIERINTDISGLQAAIDEANRAIAAAQLGGGQDGGGRKKTAARSAYDIMAENYIRRGGDTDPLKPAAIKAALTTQSEPDGGFFVPTEYDTEINRVLIRLSVLRSLARVVPVGSMVFKKTSLTQGSAWGWVGEENTRPETASPRWSEQSYPTMEIYANAGVTQGMLDDSMFDPAAFLAEEYGQVFAEGEGAAFISGSGVARPRGLLSYPIFSHTAAPDADVVPWGQIGSINTGAAAAFAATNPMDAVLRTKYALKAGYHNGASWLMNRTVAGVMRTFKDTSGRYLWEPSMQIGQPALLDGHPAYLDDNMPNQAANANILAFGDFKAAYMITDRIAMRILRDPFTNKPFVMFYATKRVGGGVSNFEALKFLQCRV